LERNPHNNLLLSCTGVDQVAVHDAERHQKWIKAQNEDSYKKNAEEKRKQSERAKEQNQAKRKAEQTGAYGQGPSKKGTASPVARTSAKVEAASSSASASVCGSTTRKAPNRIAPVVLAKIDSTLENGRNGMDAGTKRSSDTAALNGSRDRVASHLTVTVGLCI
jgi:hypothetical protein